MLSVNRLNPRLLAIAVLVMLGAAVFLLRVFPGWEFLAPDGDLVILPETDPYFHFRQALHTLNHFPSLMRWDAGSHYPAVLRNDAAGLYDLLLATLARITMLITGATSERALQWVCLFVPPAGAALLVPLVFGLVRRHAPMVTALVMALWCVLLPGDGLMRTSLGFCDHHVAEMVLGLLCIRGCMTALRLDAKTAVPWWRPAWGAALPLSLFFFTWLGAPLYLPVFALAFAGQVVADAVAGRDTGPTARAAMRYWLAFLILTGGAGLALPSLVMHVRLWWSALAGATVLVGFFPALHAYFGSSRVPLKPGAKAMIAGVTFAAAGLAVLAFPGALRDAVRDMLARKSPFVQEHVVVTTRYFLSLAGLAGVLALLTPATGVLSGAARRPGWWLAVLPSLLLVALWCRTFDYAYLGALHAVVLAGYFWGACEEAPANPRHRRIARTLLAGSTGLVLAGALIPAATVPLRPLRAWYQSPGYIASEPWREAMRWLRDRPVPALRKGVLTDWHNGNLVNTVARWPSVSSRYPEAGPLRPLFMESEAGARAAPLHGSTVAETVRYVVLEPQTVADYLNVHLATAGIDPAPLISRQIVLRQGVSTVRPGMTGAYHRLFASRLVLADGQGLNHFRLVFESRAEVFFRLVFNPASNDFSCKASLLDGPGQQAQARQATLLGFWKEDASEAYDGKILPAIRIYEQVAGARLAGNATPNSQVTATVELATTAQGRRFTHVVTTQADEAGRFTLIVPYSTAVTDASNVRSLGPWKVSCREKQWTPDVTEHAVQQGSTIYLSD